MPQKGSLVNKKGVAFIALAIATAVALYALLKPLENKSIKVDNAQKIVFGISLEPGSGLAILAYKKGFFKDVGLNIEVKTYSTGKVTLIEGLLAGNADIVTTAEFPVVYAIVEKKPLQILASIATSSNINRIVARTDAGIRTAADLSGKKIGTQQNSAVHYFLHLFLKNNSIKDDATNISFMKAGELPEALAVGKIDAFSMREPYITRAKELLGDKAVVFEAPGLYMQAQLLACAKEFPAKHPDVSKKLLKALILAQEYAKKEPEDAIATVAAVTCIPKTTYASIWRELDLRVRLDQSLLMLLEGEARWLISTMGTAQKEMPNFLEHIRVDDMAKIKPDAVTVIR